MLKDSRDCHVTTNNHMAHKVFLEGMDLYLGLDQDGTQKFNEALEYDNEFSLAYIMLARQYAVNGSPDKSKTNLNFSRDIFLDVGKAKKLLKFRPESLDNNLKRMFQNVK